MAMAWALNTSFVKPMDITQRVVTKCTSMICTLETKVSTIYNNIMKISVNNGHVLLLG